MRKVLLIVSILCVLTVICSAQKNKKQDSQNKLRLESYLPVYISPYPSNPCRSTQLIDLLRDSLAQEGFTVIDSAYYRSLVYSFFMKDMYNAVKDIRDSKELEDVFFQKVNGKKIAQQLSIENSSCLDTLHNYTIRIYIFPRAASETKSISFTLPLQQPLPPF